MGSHHWPPGEIDLVSIVTNARRARNCISRISALPAVGAVQYREFGDRGRYFMNFGLSIPNGVSWRCLRQTRLSAAEVTARTAMDKVAVSRAVNALIAAGRLHRTTAPNDRRAPTSRSPVRVSACMRAWCDGLAIRT
jgi:hypothetical protein